MEEEHRSAALRAGDSRGADDKASASRPMLPRTTLFCAELAETYEFPISVARGRPHTPGPSPSGAGALPGPLTPGPRASPLNSDDKDHLPTAMDEYGAGGRTASPPLSEALHPLSKQDREARSPSDLRPPPGERNLSSDEHEEQLMNTVGAWLNPHAATARRRAAARAHTRDWMRADAAQVTA